MGNRQGWCLSGDVAFTCDGFGTSKTDVSRFAAMKAIATLRNQVGGPTVRGS